ncbi:MAG: hypothetical protein K0S41_3566 [Anaerocolumna sp.]|jgi:hypothetical protein|nr:hypothetical protein [Anaerocolumna sp.]
MNRLRKLLIPFLIILAIVLLYFGYVQSTKTIYNNDEATGNSAGNLLNGGLFCEYQDSIYFSNDNDDGALYKMDTPTGKFEKIHEDKVAYINAVGSYLYYSRINHKREESKPSIFAFNNVGIYRFDIEKNRLKILYDDPSGLTNILGNYVYYQHYNKNEGLTFHSVKIDGQNDKLISKEPIMPLSTNKDLIYYTGTNNDHFIYTYNVKTGSSNILYEENCYAPIYNNSYIYYMSLTNDYAIYRIDADGSNPTAVVNDRCSTFNITKDGKYMYYQIDDTKNNGINRINLLTGESIIITNGDYKQIHIVGDYVFFRDFSDTNTYYQQIEQTNTLSVFNPPKSSK